MQVQVENRPLRLGQAIDGGAHRLDLAAAAGLLRRRPVLALLRLGSLEIDLADVGGSR